MAHEFREHLLEGERQGARYRLEIPRSAGSAGNGTRLGSRTGRSIDFRDYRDYQPGDDPRWIDWNVFGRSDRLTVKLYHEEVRPHLDLILDGSRSMDLPDSKKARTALGLAALLATAAANADCSSRAWISTDGGICEVRNGSGRPGAWDRLALESTRSFAEAFELRPPALRTQGIRVVISDLLWYGDPMTLMRHLGNGAASLVVIQVLADSEARAPTPGNTRLIDVETGDFHDVFVDEVEAERYLNALQQHRDTWRDVCRRTGATLDVQVAADAWDMSTLRRAGILGVL